MIPLTDKKRYHINPSFFIFFGNLPPNINGELTKNVNQHDFTSGIKITLGVVSLYSLIKTNSLQLSPAIQPEAQNPYVVFPIELLFL